MKLSKRVVGWVTCNWAKDNPEYQYNLSDSSGAAYIVKFGNLAPFTIDGYSFAVNKWVETKDYEWGVCALLIIQTTPVVAWCVNHNDSHNAPLSVEFTFEEAVQLLPEELIAEFILEGVLT